MVDHKIDDDKWMHLRPTQSDGRTETLVQCRLHRPMEGVQGFTWSHWTPSLVEYLHRIPPLDDRVAFLKKTIKKHHISSQDDIVDLQQLIVTL